MSKCDLKIIFGDNMFQKFCQDREPKLTIAQKKELSSIFKVELIFNFSFCSFQWAELFHIFRRAHTSELSGFLQKCNSPHVTLIEDLLLVCCYEHDIAVVVVVLVVVAVVAVVVIAVVEVVVVVVVVEAVVTDVVGVLQ